MLSTKGQWKIPKFPNLLVFQTEPVPASGSDWRVKSLWDISPKSVIGRQLTSVATGEPLGKMQRVVIQSSKVEIKLAPRTTVSVDSMLAAFSNYCCWCNDLDFWKRLKFSWSEMENVQIGLLCNLPLWSIFSTRFTKNFVHIHFWPK